jgi:5-methyltetrahydropteroyltriglutamate--homocysteine methyltransferase
MAQTHVLGLPRIGAQRELKFAVESFWRGESGEAALRETGLALRRRNRALQAAAGLARVAAGDFAWYDHLLDTALLLGAVPERFGLDARRITLADSFKLARGTPLQPAMAMTKWFDTNYHVLVPEVGPGTQFGEGVEWLYEAVAETQAEGQTAKPVLVGPLTFLWLARSADPAFDRLRLAPALAVAYAAVLKRLKAQGVEWVQLDEPALALDLPPAWLDAAEKMLQIAAAEAPRLLLATYFERVDQHAARLVQWPVHGIHLDLVRAPRQLDTWLAQLPSHWVLSAGVIDGRNIWRCDLRRELSRLQPLQQALGDRLWVAPSCSLLHVPVSLASERQSLPADVRSWLAFAHEKLQELAVLGRALNEGTAVVREELAEADAAIAARREAPRVHNAWVRRRLAGVDESMTRRHSPYARRAELQRAALQLPPLPTTTIGSFPQTPAIRAARAAHKRGELGAFDYLQRMREEIAGAVARQEALGLDVLVHGEAERNDMVEYFGERLWGFAFSDNGWVQSYGSRCVKPPIIYGDVFRPEPMTVDTARYAQSLTERPMKGMLTGPVTMLQWSFVRDDQPREQTALQIALAIRDEVKDLEAAGIRIIQIDEPAFREGLPLPRADWDAYLAWAVRAFKLASCTVADATQIHTHMCYSEFNDILPSIAAMDADVITIETSRSRMKLLDGFGRFAYPNEIGPGVYDIHSPRLPSEEEMLALLDRAAGVIPPERLWVNPDCGLKTRGWPETEEALRRMVQAARALRERLFSTQPQHEEAAPAP